MNLARNFRCLLAVVFSLLAGPVFGQSLAGTYKCEGTDSNGANPYSGHLAITKAGQGVFGLNWQLGKGGDYVGTGLVVGNVLAAGYGGSKKPYGLVVYKINGGTLSGQWVVGGTIGIGQESLSGPEGLAGTYQITSAVRPNGQSYTGTVAIAKNGDAYTVTWTLPEKTYRGVGILHNNLLVVGWGEGANYGTIVYDIGGGRLTGEWAAAGAGPLGAERLEKE